MSSAKIEVDENCSDEGGRSELANPSHCQYCGIYIQISTTRDHHMKSHEREDGHVCSFCGIKTEKPSDRNRHELEVHGFERSKDDKKSKEAVKIPQTDLYIYRKVGTNFEMIQRSAVPQSQQDATSAGTVDPLTDWVNVPMQNSTNQQNSVPVANEFVHIQRLKQELVEKNAKIAAQSVELVELVEMRKERDECKTKIKAQDCTIKVLKESVANLTAERDECKTKLEAQDCTIKVLKESTSNVTAERGKINPTIFNLCKELYKKTVTFDSQEWKDDCIELLKSQLTTKTSPELMILAVEMNDLRLIKIVIDFMNQHGGKINLVYDR
ncbi:hypothetical protein M3Y94_00487300 [Aphelenchoides besseyi]|nr:hypothetical protein M3Y94_00487300 [Aphelenchoides besseyi]KAI6217880.1 hypothetical protein M3Y95_01189900 [Aphelenchoides besseyi]